MCERAYEEAAPVAQIRVAALVMVAVLPGVAAVVALVWLWPPSFWGEADAPRDATSTAADSKVEKSMMEPFI